MANDAVATATLQFQQMGYNGEVAEALAERNIPPKGVSEGYYTPEELFTEFCEWNGIIGFSGMLQRGLDNLREVHKKEV